MSRQQKSLINSLFDTANSAAIINPLRFALFELKVYSIN